MQKKSGKLKKPSSLLLSPILTPRDIIIIIIVHIGV